MGEDLRKAVEEAQGRLERLARAIPGYSGYKEKEVRRQADKLLRTHLAREFEVERRRLGEVQARLADTGRLASIVTLERAMMKFQLLSDRLKTASYGYAGWFDAVKVQEEELDALYQFDGALAEGVDKVKAILDRLSEAAAKEEVTAQPANDLLNLLQELNDTFTKRQDVIIGAV